MARPTTAQYATGSATVVLATLALLLLTGTTEGPGLALVACAALALGLLAAGAVPGARRAAEAGGRREPIRPAATRGGVAVPGGERGLRG
ncbi:hypothetical protein [Streptomyces sp. NPDC058374]|uniref:hypothetical protein n=1 Tax=unclassified Streptomyces TaxID=2593676 RepID=UPI003656B889